MIQRFFSQSTLLLAYFSQRGTITTIMIVLLFVSVFLIVFALWSLSRQNGPAGDEWVVIARPSDRNQAYMVRAMLADNNIPCYVNEDTTMGVLYGLPDRAGYAIQVPDDRSQRARTLLSDSGFDDILSSAN